MKNWTLDKKPSIERERNQNKARNLKRNLTKILKRQLSCRDALDNPTEQQYDLGDCQITRIPDGVI